MAQETFTFGHLSYLVFESVIQVVIISLAGFWSTHVGLLPKQSQKVLSRLNVDLFTPCLIFSKLAKSLSMAKILEISIIPVFFGVATGTSYISGRLVSKFLSLDKDETNFVIANSIFGNSNSLPVSMTLSLAYTLPNLTWDQIPNDNRDNVASRGILYLLIFQQMGQMLRWSWGYNKLLRWSGENQHHMPETQVRQMLEPNGIGDQSNGASSTQLSQGVLEAEFSTESFWGKKFQSVNGVIDRLKSYLNPPLYSMILAIIVASIAPLQKNIFEEGTFLGNTFGVAVTDLGSVSIPLILIVLGSNIYPSNETPPKTSNYNRLVFGSLIGRMVVPSCILLPIIAICVKYINVSILDDPIFLIVGFLLTVSPPAIQLTQITQLNEFFEAEMANILFWGYAVLSLPVSIIVVSGAIYVLQWADINHVKA